MEGWNQWAYQLYLPTSQYVCSFHCQEAYKNLLMREPTEQWLDYWFEAGKQQYGFNLIPSSSGWDWTDNVVHRVYRAYRELPLVTFNTHTGKWYSINDA